VDITDQQRQPLFDEHLRQVSDFPRGVVRHDNGWCQADRKSLSRQDIIEMEARLHPNAQLAHSEDAEDDLKHT
jgi:hypothetical protein